MFELSILGCNALYPSNQINTSGYLLTVDDTNILLDAGSGVFAELKKRVKPESVSAVFISHLHFDHISDLGVYNYYLEFLAKKGLFFGKIKLIVKKSESAVYQSIAGLNYFEIVNFDDETPILLDNLKLSFFKNGHPVETYGVTVCYNDKVFTYASDGNICDNLERAIKESDLTVCHAPFKYEERGENKPHPSALEVCKIAKKYGSKIVISHLFPDCDNSALKEECFAEYDNCIFAVQGEKYSI